MVPRISASVASVGLASVASASTVPLSSAGTTTLFAEAEGGVFLMSCITFIIRRFFGPPTFPPPAEAVSFPSKLRSTHFSFARLSPPGSDLTSLLQSKEKGVERSLEGKETASAGGGNVGGSKKRRMMNVMQAIKKTPPPASVKKIAMFVDAEGTEAKPTEATEAENIGTTMSEIDKLISDMTPEIDIN